MSEQSAVHEGTAAPGGGLGLESIRADGSREAAPERGGTGPTLLRAVHQQPLGHEHGIVPAHELSWREVVRYGLPHADLPPEIREWRARNARHLLRGARRVVAARLLGRSHFYGALSLRVIEGVSGREIDLGLVSMRVVTNTGVGFIVDAFQNLVELENLKFHALGTGVTAEAAGDTALVTELTTEYTGNVRATGTTTESAANIYRTVGTNTLDGTPGAALREHGIFDQAATGGGVLLDRTLFAAITLSSGDGLQSTYDMTLTAGS